MFLFMVIFTAVMVQTVVDLTHVSHHDRQALLAPFHISRLAACRDLLLWPGVTLLLLIDYVPRDHHTPLSIIAVSVWFNLRVIFCTWACLSTKSLSASH